MKEEIQESTDEVGDALAAVKELALSTEKDAIRFRHLYSYTCGQYDAWATLVTRFNELMDSPTKEEER